MNPGVRWLVLALVLCASCAQKPVYGPAVPVPRWDNSQPFIPHVPPPAALLPSVPPVPQRPLAGVLPSPEAWAQWQPLAPPVTRCVGKGKRRRCKTVRPSVVATAQARAVIKPTLAHFAGANSAMVRYPFDAASPAVHIYEIHTALNTPTFLTLPPGETLAIPLPLQTVDLEETPEDDRRWDVIYPQTEEGTITTVILMPLVAPQTQMTGAVLRSGKQIFLKLLAKPDGAMLAVTWDAPQKPAAAVVPVAHRPPQIHEDRLFSTYTVEVQGALPPPWMPVSVVDDGSKTLVKFVEPLTFTRAPVVVGLDQQGHTTLVQSQMYVPPQTQPDAGAFLVIQGIHPALLLTDSAGLAIRIVRGDVRAPLMQGGNRHGY